MKHKSFTSLTLLLLAAASGCVSRDGVIPPEDLTLAVPQGHYTLKTEWAGESRDIARDTNGNFHFQTPLILWSDNLWFGIIPQRTSADERRVFLHVFTNGHEVLSLSPEQLWRLPKDDSGASLLQMR
jgi:hypothetical protein